MDIAHDLLYKDPVSQGENKVYNLNDGTKWSARTSNNWANDGDMTWIDPANEWTYEFILQFWRKGGFDQVLDTLGEKFGSEGLWVDGTSFIIVSNFHGSNIHTDLEGAQSKVFNIQTRTNMFRNTTKIFDKEPWVTPREIAQCSFRFGCVPKRDLLNNPPREILRFLLGMVVVVVFSGDVDCGDDKRLLGIVCKTK